MLTGPSEMRCLDPEVEPHPRSEGSSNNDDSEFGRAAQTPGSTALALLSGVTLSSDD